TRRPTRCIRPRRRARRPEPRGSPHTQAFVHHNTYDKETPMTSPVLYHAAEGVATITLNRPDVLNALNSALMLELRAAVERAAQDEAVRAVVLTANGRGFCAGAD